MVEVTPGSAALSPTSLNPVAAPLVAPGADPTARTERATRASQESNRNNDRQQRVVEDRVDVRRQEADDERRARDRGDEDHVAMRTLEAAESEHAAEESAARDHRSVDFRT